MLLTEETLANAVTQFMRSAKIPRPRGWSINMDQQYVNRIIVPAFYAALLEIEDVSPCYGFDLSKVLQPAEQAGSDPGQDVKA